MTDSFRIGVVGLGRIAQAAHLPAIEKAEGVSLEAVMDPAQGLVDHVVSRYSTKGFTRLEDFLEQDLDGVVIAVPDRLHAEVGIRVISSGRPILMEKPLAPSFDEASEIVAAGREEAVAIHTGFMKRHDPGVRYAHDALARIGELYSAHAWYRVMSEMRPGIQQTFFPVMATDAEVARQENQTKLDNPAYRLVTHGSHVFDLIRFLTGEAQWVSAHTAVSGDDQAWHGVVGSARGALTSFDLVKSVHAPWSEGLDLYGSRGHIRLSLPYVFSRQSSTVEVFDAATGQSTTPHFVKTDVFVNQIEAFASAVSFGSRPESGEDALRSVRLMDAVIESVSGSGHRIDL